MSNATYLAAVQNLHCGACAIRLEAALAALDGVTRVAVNATDHRVRIDHDPEIIDAEGLQGEAARAGYPLHDLRAAAPDVPQPSLLVPLAVAGFGTMNVMSFSISVWAGGDMGAATRDAMHLASAVIAIGVTGFSGRVFFDQAARDLRSGRVGMDVPISIAILATLAASFLAPLGLAEESYFDAVVSLIFLLLIGRVLDQAMRRRSRSAAENLRALVSGSYLKCGPEGPVTVFAETLVPGDRIVVRRDQVVPRDGRVEGGDVLLDLSLLTGEAAPVALGTGSLVRSGSRCLQAPFDMTVTATQDDSAVGKIAALVEAFEAGRGRAQRLADGFAAAYAPMVLGGAAAGFLIWFALLGATLPEATMIAVAVLVVTCPCAAGLATPAALASATNGLLADGVLIRSGRALEDFGDVSAIVFDKTGTLTTPRVVDTAHMPADARDRAARLAAASPHPLSAALVSAVGAHSVDAAAQEAPEGLAGEAGTRLGSARFVGVEGAVGTAPMMFRDTDGAAYPIHVVEELRPGVTDMLAYFRAREVDLVILSGDRPERVDAIGHALGIAPALGGLDPEGKAARLLQMQRDGHAQVAMVGDGVNDAPALSAASVSISFGHGSDIAQTVADMVVMGEDLSKLARAHRIACRTRRIIRQNLGMSALYNILALPLALAGWITPLAAAVLMASSSIMVMLNAQRIRR